MARPNCLVIGAMRSGTSTLYQLLAQHPDIFMSTPKEPNYFAFPDEPAPPIEGSNSITAWDEYLGLFTAGAAHRIRGEASHNYMYFADRAAGAIRAKLDDVKLLAVLRHPVDRAFSHYMLHVRNDREDAPSFAVALAKEPERIDRGEQFGHYLSRGQYVRQLTPFLEHFPRDAVRIYLYDDLAADPNALVRDVYNFLGVDPGYRPDTSVRSNPSGVPRSRALHAVLVRDNPAKRLLQPLLPPPVYRWAIRLRDRNLDRRTIDPEVYRRLEDHYRGEIEELQDLIGRDLSAWLG